MIHVVELVNFHSRRRIHQGSYSLIHVLRDTELGYSLQSSIQLIAHDRNDVVAEDHSLIIDQCFCLKEHKSISKIQHNRFFNQILTQILALTSFPASRCLPMSSFFLAMALSFLLRCILSLTMAYRKWDYLYVKSDKNLSWVHFGDIQFATAGTHDFYYYKSHIACV